MDSQQLFFAQKINFGANAKINSNHPKGLSTSSGTNAIEKLARQSKVVSTGAGVAMKKPSSQQMQSMYAHQKAQIANVNTQ